MPKARPQSHFFKNCMKSTTSVWIVTNKADLHNRYGFFQANNVLFQPVDPSLTFRQTSNSYFVCNDPTTTDTIFARIRKYDVRS